MWRISLLILLLSACSHDSGQRGEDTDLAKRPNILLIVADDLGYSDIGAFGSEIATPNLDNLAAQGLVLTNFYTGPTCSVSRAMLLSGADNHIAGLGNMAETVSDNQLGKPGYEGHLNDRVATIAETLKALGYRTYMAGKWHLGMAPEQSPFQRGFDQTFALLYGGASHFADMAGPDTHRNPAIYRENGRLVSELPAEFFSTSFYTDRIIEQIDSEADSTAPFFAYLSYTAPHWPLQAPDDYIDKYAGRYAVGYDTVREQRFAKQQTLKLLPADLGVSERPADIPAWAELTVEKRASHARNMEIYAAMVDHMDMSIGRVLDYLRARGSLDNTLIVFMSDNGADQWSLRNAPPAVGEFAATFDNSPSNLGREGSFVFYGPEWAHVSNTPFTRYKGTTYQGGIRSPAIVYWPERIQTGQMNDALAFITDWYPTFVEVAGGDAATTGGKSLAAVLDGSAQAVREPADYIGIEVWGKRSIVGQRYKMVSSPVRPHGQADWELYDLSVDPSETTDLATTEPDRLQDMQDAWNTYAATSNVILPEGPFKIRPVGDKPTE
ncbi:MAG: arylsulfatase [Pseudomonadota bacterium]